MVAGMVMPLADLRAIYELLFRDGVVVAKKDKRPQSMHPDLKGLTNLKVMRVMASLKSSGCVRETVAWKHAYYYITNAGIAYLRAYLNLPPEILPASVRRVPRPASSDAAKGVATETGMDRHSYRHQRAGGKVENRSERPPQDFRDCEASVGWSGGFKDSCRREERWTEHCNARSFDPTERKVLEILEEVKTEVECGEHAAVDQRTMTEEAVGMMRHPNVEVSGLANKAWTSDPVRDSASMNSFRDLMEEEVVVYDASLEDSTATMENTIPMKTTSDAAGRPGPADPSGGPVPALKTPLLQGDPSLLTEEAEEQDVQEVWPDFLEGLSLS